MSHKVYKISGGKRFDITDLVGGLTWSDSIDTLGMQMDFDLAFSDMPQFPKNVLSVGDIVLLNNGTKEIFRGIAVAEERQGRSSRHFTCFDFAFYLNKSKTIIQFNKVKASEAIQKLLQKFNVKSNITNIPTIIKKIYKEDVVSDIIKDILDQATKQTGHKYRMEMRAGTLVIERQSNLMVTAEVNAISNPTRKLSIEEMKNSILIVSGDENSTKIFTEVKDQRNISKYGLLQEIQSIDKKDKAQAKNIANNLLKELNKIFEENSIELLGNDNVRAGRVLNLNEKVTGMVGNYLITSCTHTINQGIHKMSLNLGVM
jgi:hypothetical protein